MEDPVGVLEAQPKSFAGSSTAIGPNYRIVVANKAGYLCNIHLKTNWKCAAPDVLYAILTHPGNGKLLRGMKRVGSRTILRAEPGFLELQIHTITKVRKLLKHGMYNSWLHVVEDMRNPECLSIKFDLVKSEFFLKFTGRWELRLARDPVSGQVVGCQGELTQDVLPKGAPRILTRLPLLGSLLRRMSLGPISQLMDDLNTAVDKVLLGHAAGKSTAEVLDELCVSSTPAAENVDDVAEDLAGGGLATRGSASLTHHASTESASSCT